MDWETKKVLLLMLGVIIILLITWYIVLIITYTPPSYVGEYTNLRQTDHVYNYLWHLDT
ncbi:MAG: hypothetical protein ABIE23_02710 [archaeon]|nr:hypothetical protein [Candidatus Micrarchaeota archaeon]